MRQNVSTKKCSNGELELFSKQYLSSNDTQGGYHLTVKEKLSSIASSTIIIDNNNYLIDEDQMIEYQSKITIVVQVALPDLT